MQSSPLITIDLARPCVNSIFLGKQGENGVTEIVFEFAAWAGRYGAGQLQGAHKRSGDAHAYPVTLEQDGTQATWTIGSADVANPGDGLLELRYIVGDKCKISTTFAAIVLPSLEPGADPPPEYEAWLDSVLQAASETADARDATLAALEDFQTPTADMTPLPPGSDPTVNYDGHAFHFGLPAGGGGGSGDMLKATYDANDNGIVDNSEALDGHNAAYFATAAALGSHTGNSDIHVTASDKTSWSGKQDAISDLSDIRSGAEAGATAYQKPGTGVPSSDMSSAVQTSLDKADSAYQKPSGGIPSTDMAAAVQASLALADTALQSYTETDPTVPAWAKADNKPSYTYSEVGAEQSGAVNTHNSDASAHSSLFGSKLDVAQGVADAGKFLVVGSDGNITKVTLEAWSGGSY